MIVMKFGGTSVEDARAIGRLMTIVRGQLKEKPVVVVSALAKVTDSLIRMAQLAAGGSLPESLKLLREVRQRFSWESVMRKYRAVLELPGQSVAEKPGDE